MPLREEYLVEIIGRQVSEFRKYRPCPGEGEERSLRAAYGRGIALAEKRVILKVSLYWTTRNGRMTIERKRGQASVEVRERGQKLHLGAHVGET